MKHCLALSIVAFAISMCAASVHADAEGRSVKFSATATGIVPTTPVEFFFVAPGSDRDYEAMFITDDSAAKIAKAFEKGGIPEGRFLDERACRFWPAGRRIKITPDPWQFISDKELPDGPLPLVYTGGERDASGAPVADTNMPAAVFALYNVGQSMIMLDDTLDQSVVYGRFIAKKGMEKGEKVEFTVSWDGASGTVQYPLLLEPGNLKESIEAMRSAATDCGLDVTPSFSPDLTLAEATTAANALAVLDSRQVRVNGFKDGQFFYRAFLPLEKWRDRKERLAQPLEVHLSATHVDYTVVDEDWNVEGLDPILTPRTVDHDEAVKVKTDTCFVFASSDTKLARLYEIKKSLPSSLCNWYFYIDQQ